MTPVLTLCAVALAGGAVLMCKAPGEALALSALSGMCGVSLMSRVSSVILERA